MDSSKETMNLKNAVYLDEILWCLEGDRSREFTGAWTIKRGSALFTKLSELLTFYKIPLANTAIDSENVLSQSVLLEVKQCTALFDEFNTRRAQDKLQQTNLENITLETISLFREYYFTQRRCAIEIVINLCRIGRDTKHFLSSSASSILTDLFSVVESKAGDTSSALVDGIFNSIKNITSNPLPPLQKSLFDGLKVKPNWNDLFDFLNQHSLSRSCSLISEIGLLLELLILILRSGCRINQSQILKLYEYGIAVGFSCPKHLFESLSENSTISKSIEFLNFQWAILLTEIIDFRQMLTSPRENIIIQALSDDQSFRKTFFAEVITPLKLSLSIIGENEDSSNNALYLNHQALKISCIRYIFYFLKVFFEFSGKKLQVMGIQEMEVAEYCFSLSRDMKRVSRQIDAINYIENLSIKFLNKPSNILSWFAADTSSRSNFSHSSAINNNVMNDENENESWTPMWILGSSLYCVIIQEFLDGFILDTFQDSDEMDFVLGPQLFSLISISYRNNFDLCRPFWEQWSVYRSASIQELETIRLEPFSPLCILLNFVLVLTYDPICLMKLITSLICDQDSSRECLGFLSEPVVIRTWENISNLRSLEKSKDPLQNGTHVILHNSGIVDPFGNISNLFDVIATPNKDSVGEIVDCSCLETGVSNKVLVRWSDDNCTSWWGICIHAIALQLNGVSPNTDDNNSIIDSGLMLLSQVFRYEHSDKARILNHLESHWNELVAFHVFKHFGISQNTSEYVSILKSNNVTPQKLRYCFNSEEESILVLKNVFPNLRNEIVYSIVKLFRYHYQTFASILQLFCVEGFRYSVSTIENCCSQLQSRGPLSLLSSTGILSTLELMETLTTIKDPSRFGFDLLYYENLGEFYTKSSLSDSFVQNTSFIKSIERICSQLHDNAAILIQYAVLRIFKKLLLPMVSPDKIQDLRSLFNRLDVDNSGKITEREFVAGLTELYGKEASFLIVKNFFFRSSRFIEYQNFFDAALFLQNNRQLFVDSNCFCEPDEWLYSVLMDALKLTNSSSTGASHLLSNMIEFCVHACVTCESIKTKTSNGLCIPSNAFQDSSKVQILCIELIQTIFNDSTNLSKLTLSKDWLINTFISDSVFQTVLLRLSMEIGVAAVSLKAISSYNDSMASGRNKMNRSNISSGIKTMKDLIDNTDTLTESSVAISNSFKSKLSVLPLDYGHVSTTSLTQKAIISPVLHYEDILILESLSEKSLSLLISIVDTLLAKSESVDILATIINVFYFNHSFRVTPSNNLIFVSSGYSLVYILPLSDSDALSNFNMAWSYFRVLCGMIDYKNSAQQVKIQFTSCVESNFNGRISSLASRLLSRLIFSESLIKDSHLNKMTMSVTNQTLDIIGSDNIEWFTKSICAILLNESSKNLLSSSKYADSLFSKIEIMKLLLCLSKYDYIIFGHLTLVESDTPIISETPPIPGRNLKSQRQGCISNAIIGLLASLESVANFKPSNFIVEELCLLDLALKYLLSCWETNHARSSAVIASHVLEISSSNAFWSVITSPLMKDYEPVASDFKKTEDIKQFRKFNADIKSYCYKLSIISSAFEFLALERFNRVYSLEDMAIRRRDRDTEIVKRTKLNDESEMSRPIGDACRKRVDDFFRRITEHQKFTYWVEIYPNINIDFGSDDKARHNAVDIGLSIDSFLNKASIQNIDSFAAVYNLQVALNSAFCHGWKSENSPSIISAKWSNFLTSLMISNSMWCTVDAQQNLMKKFRHFLEVSVFPPDNVYFSHGSSDQVISKRSSSFELGSVKSDGIPMSGSFSPKIRRSTDFTQLSPRSSLPHYLLPPSPSMLSGESSFIGDKRSYVLLFGILRSVANGPSSRFSNKNEMNNLGDEENSLLSNNREEMFLKHIEKLEIVLSVDKVALILTMLHHQLKNVNVRTADPSQAQTDFRDSNSSRLTVSTIVQLLESLNLAYNRIFNGVNGIISKSFLQTSSEKDLVASFWKIVWSHISTDLLSCMQLLLEAIERMHSELENEKELEDLNNARFRIFNTVMTILTKHFSENSNFGNIFVDEIVKQNSTKNPANSSLSALSFRVSTICSLAFDPFFLSDKFDITSTLSSIFQHSRVEKDISFVAISFQVIRSAIPPRELLSRNSMMSIWDKHLANGDLGLKSEFLINVVDELLHKLSSADVSKECNYSLWDNISDYGIASSISEDLLVDSVENGCGKSRAYYELSNVFQHWESIGAIFDILHALVDCRLLNDSDVSRMMIVMNGASILKDFQSSLLSQRENAKVGLLMAYSPLTGDKSPLCSIYIKYLRLYTSITCNYCNNTNRNEKFYEKNQYLLSPLQLLQVFLENYQNLLLLPYFGGSNRISIGQIKLVQVVTALFDACNRHNCILPVFSFKIRQLSVSSIAVLSNLVGDGLSLSTTKENLRKNLVCITESEKYNSSETKSNSEPIADRTRSQSLDSLDTNAGKEKKNSTSKNFSSNIEILLEALTSLLSFTLFTLPSPFLYDSTNSMHAPSNLSIGSSVLYRTIRSFTYNSNDQDSLSKSMSNVASKTRIESVLQDGVIIEISNTPNVFGRSDSKYQIETRNLAGNVVTILLNDGTIEDGVPVDAIVSGSRPMIPFLTKESVQIEKSSISTCGTAHLLQILQFLTSSRFEEICKDVNVKKQNQEFPYESLMGMLLSCIISSYSHNSIILRFSESDAFSLPNILQIREQFCNQIQELLGSLFRRRNSGNSEENYWLHDDNWKEYLKYFEKCMLELMRRHTSHVGDFDNSYVSQDRRSSSPVPFENSTKMSEGTLRSGPVFLELL